jgi:hypothetical protein
MAFSSASRRFQSYIFMDNVEVDRGTDNKEFTLGTKANASEGVKENYPVTLGYSDQQKCTLNKQMQGGLLLQQNYPNVSEPAQMLRNKSS